MVETDSETQDRKDVVSELNRLEIGQAWGGDCDCGFATSSKEYHADKGTSWRIAVSTGTSIDVEAICYSEDEFTSLHEHSPIHKRTIFEDIAREDDKAEGKGHCRTRSRRTDDR